MVVAPHADEVSRRSGALLGRCSFSRPAGLREILPAAGGNVLLPLRFRAAGMPGMTRAGRLCPRESSRWRQLVILRRGHGGGAHWYSCFPGTNENAPNLTFSRCARGPRQCCVEGCAGLRTSPAPGVLQPRDREISAAVLWKKLVPLAGLEPARVLAHLILSQARLPVPPQGQGEAEYNGGR